MNGTAIHIGTAVHSADGHHLGDVDQLVLAADTRHIVYVVIDKGIFDEGRLVEPVSIASADEMGVTLNLTRAEAEQQLVPYVKKEFAQFRDVETFEGGIEPSNLTGSDKWVLLGSGGGGLPQTGAFGLLPPPIAGDIVTETFTNVGDETTAISAGTDVLDINGKKIGKVDEVLVDSSQAITGFIVKAGFLFHHDLEVPIAWVQDVGSEHIRLSHSVDEVESYHR